MKTKVYILLNVGNFSPADVMLKLRGQLGVKNVEMLDGSPEIMVTVETSGRRKLARLSISAIESVEDAITSVKLLPVQEVAPALLN